jgi:hypothetical protein
MKHVYLVEAAACLIVVATWTVPLARPTLTAPDNLGTAGRRLLVQVGLLSLLARRVGLAVRHRGADEQVRETGELTAARDNELDRVLPGGFGTRTRGRSQ